MWQTSPSMMIVSLVLLSLVALETGNAMDRTTESGGAGQLVVTETVARIHASCIFSNGFLFLRRLAYVISDYGLDNDTYRRGFDGGIWQISETQFTDTLHLTSVDYSKIQEVLKIDWQQSQWSDLRKPLYSGLAAMLILNNSTTIPRDIPEQARFYKDVWSGNEIKYTVEASYLDSECESDSIDIAFLLDASGSISSSQYDESKHFVANVIDGFNIGFDSVRVSVTSFSNAVHNHFNFLDYDTSASAMQAALTISKEHLNTATFDGLHNLRTVVFTNQSGSRSNSARVAIVLTDGKSDNTSRTAAAAAKLKETVVVFAIGVGDGVDIDELHDIASSPTCSHVRLLKDFTELDSIVSDIKYAACKSETILARDTTNIYKCSGSRTFKFHYDDEISVLISTYTERLGLSGSVDITGPNSGRHDFNEEIPDGKPVVIYLSNQNGSTLYFTLDALDVGEEQCNSTYLIKTVELNALKKTGAVNKCLTQFGLGGCSDLDFVKSGNYSTVNGTQNSDEFKRLCGDGTVGYRSHPETPTKYVYCAEGDEAYVVNCSDGFAYSRSQQDCAVPASEDRDAMCKVCTSDNWEVGFRRFPLLSSKTGYVECIGVEQCEKRECESGRHYLPNDQKCSDGFSSAPMAGVPFITFSLCFWCFYLLTS